MKTKLKVLTGLVFLIFVTTSLSLVAVAETASHGEGLFNDNEEVRLAPGEIGLLAMVITVDTTDDGLNDGDGQCSLREAIQSANTDANVDSCVRTGSGSDDIIILSSDTYTLTISGSNEDNNATGDLDITSAVTIQGVASNTTIIRSNGTDRVFDISSAGVVTISDVTITNGGVSGNFEEGGGIRNRGTLILNDSIVSGNNVSSPSSTDPGGVLGGGIANIATGGTDATLTVNRSQIVNNTVNGVGGGGISNSANSNRTATIVLSKTLVSGNVATFTNVISLAGFGGGIRNGFFTGATNATANVTLNNSTISNNKAINAGGLGSGTLGVPGSITVMLDKSTVSGNTAVGSGSTVGTGGGIVNLNSTMTLVNSTVSGNAANGAGSTTSGVGGGFTNVGADVTTTLWLSSTTISGNTGLAGTAVADIPLGNTMETKFRNTIIDGSCASPLGGTFTSLDYNLESGNSCGLASPHDLINTSPWLGSLRNNGGDTETHALLVGSSAINAGICNGAPTDDQRGQPRPDTISALCDIGAYEGTWNIYLPIIVKNV